MDLVSVIIPYYKKRNFVKKAIISVLNQSYDNFEILLIFDDTNLNDFDFLKEIAKLDKRINLIKNNIRLGAGLSRNVGIEQSNGKYVAFLEIIFQYLSFSLKNQCQ